MDETEPTTDVWPPQTNIIAAAWSLSAQFTDIVIALCFPKELILCYF